MMQYIDIACVLIIALLLGIVWVLFIMDDERDSDDPEKPGTTHEVFKVKKDE